MDTGPYAGPVHALMSWTRRHPLAVDAALGLLILGAGGAGPGDRAGATWVRFVFAAAMAIGVTVRRRWPRGSFALVAATGFAQYLADVPFKVFDVAIIIGLYTIAAHRGRRDAAVAFVVAEIGAVLAAFRWAGDPWAAIIAPTVAAAAAVVLGESMRVRRAYLAQLEQRAARLERERDQQAEIAAAAERSRIARELHDVVAHSLTVMVAQADGAGYALDRDPQQARHAMATVAETGREALTEMRRLLGVLRSPESPDGTTPQPGLQEVDDLIDRVRDAGLSIRVTRRGEPRTLPAGMGLAAYRIVQEALTNTLKHAGPTAHADVTITYADHCFEVLVDDDGRATQAAPARPGQGLTGMRERAAMYGGTVMTRVKPDGGYRVVASLPIPT
jgi:signal transduction histidine kinase